MTPTREQVKEAVEEIKKIVYGDFAHESSYMKALETLITLAEQYLSGKIGEVATEEEAQKLIDDVIETKLNPMLLFYEKPVATAVCNIPQGGTGILMSEELYNKLIKNSKPITAEFEALKKISEYQMPKGQIKPEDVTLENMTGLTHCIQDMAGIAKSAMLKEGKE